MKNLKGLLICSILMVAAAFNVFADTEVKSQMQWNYNQDSEMGTFDLDEGDIAFTTTDGDWSYKMELEFSTSKTTNSDIIELMYFDYAASEALSVKAGLIGTAFADGWWVGREEWGVGLYGNMGVIGYELDVVNGNGGDKFELQPVVTVSPIDSLTLSFDGCFDLSDDTDDYSDGDENAVAASIDYSFEGGWFFTEVYYGLEQETYMVALEAGYEVVEDVTAEAYVELYEDATTIGGYLDFTALPVNIKPGMKYYISDDSSVDGNYGAYIELEYDFSL